jgi:serine/threonine protein kinase/WD40 repeat protein/tetratricopeptide (TPR) repeat protein
MSASEIQHAKDEEQEHVEGPAPQSDRDPMGSILESFLARFRKGERPSLTEYIGRYPGLADEIRELLPALVEIEQLGSMGSAAKSVGADRARSEEPGPAQRQVSATEPLGPGDGLAAADGDRAGPCPERLGDYRILGVIGEGGMGVVYEAVRESLHSHVALKVMHPRYRASAGYLRRFHNEARSAAQLHHTNIVSVFDYGEHDGVCYYAMQYIPGHSLEQILVDVRRLRSNRDPAQAVPFEAGPAADATGDPISKQAHRGATGSAVVAGPRLRAVTHGLLTGQFAPGAGVAVDNDAAPPAPTEPIGPGADERAAATHDLAFELVRPHARSSPRTRDSARYAPESAVGLSSSSLAGQGEDRYHREVARLGAQVADALAHAHKRAVLHRDIKPSNLLLDAVGNVWVTDFGLAKFEEREDLSRSQDVVGTLRYMAPERFRGVSDRRCDLYALGATLYELLTLRPAFESHDRLRLIDQIVNEPPAPPRQLDRRIPRDLETIVLKALAKDPMDRFASADELGSELRRFLENRPIRSRPIPAYERIWRWCKRNPKLAAASIAAALLTTLLAVVSTIAAWTYHGQSSELRFEKSLTEANLHRAEHAEREARLALGGSLVSEGAALQRTGLIGQRFKSLERHGQAALILGADPEGRKHLPEIRNHAIAALGLTDLRLLWQYDRGDASIHVAVDAALQRFALAERSGEVVVRRLDDGRELVRLPGPKRQGFSSYWSRFSPDGQMLVAGYRRPGGDGDLIQVWHLGRMELLMSLLSPNGYLAFHPDNRRALFHPPEGGIAVWDREERRVVRRLALDFAPHYFELDPEGRRLAVNNTDAGKPRVVILELETGRVLADLRPKFGNGSLAWSADGQLLAVGSDFDTRVDIWNVRRGVLASVLEGHTSNIHGAQFAHSGFLLATTSWHSMTRLWDAASGEALLTAPGYHRGFSPDDRRLAIHHGSKIEVWEVAAAPECQTLHPRICGNRTEERRPAGVSTADISSDGRLVATGDGDGVRLWEADTGRELASLKAGSCDTVLFHPDGKSLISSSGSWGLYRWPIRPDPERGADAICVGPPGLLRDAGAGPAAWLPDRRTLAQLDNTNARVLLIDSSHPHPAWSRALVLDNRGDHSVRTIAVSPDGRWLAAGRWNNSGIQVWDLRKRRLERILRPKEAVGAIISCAGFSPDRQWLVSDSSSGRGSMSYHFWRVGTWEPGHRIDQERDGDATWPPAFTSDGRLMAVGIAPDQILLAEAATGRELARLTTLQPVTPTPLTFSPDGTKLVATTRFGTALAWDLRRIREQLTPIGLDWDAPPYPTVNAASEASDPPPPPRRVRVIGEVVEPQARRAGELAEMDRRLAVNPDDADALIHRGWLFSQQKKWPEAIADLNRRLRLRPEDADARWLLAEAYHETGNLAGALAAMSRLLEQTPDDRDVRFQRGLLALAQDQPGVAEEDFRRVLAAEPDLERARYRRAQALIRLGRHRDALAELDILIPNAPQDYALYLLRGTVREALGDSGQARGDREKTSALLPKDPMELNNRAWTLATGPIDERDPERAVALARRAVALAPGQQLSLNTLGVALYRVGQYAEAVSVLKQSLTAGKGEFDAFDLFFLAMTHRRLGHATEARACFDRAVRWWSERKSLPAQYIPELTGFRAEAEEVLALAGPSAELPADVFAHE